MTYWCEIPDGQKDLWYWMGVATSLSLALGLHSDPIESNTDIKYLALLRRIGWSCFIRDQIVALGTQRPARIKRKDHTLSMLSAADFDSSEYRLRGNIIRLDHISSIYIEVAKLSICLGHVLDVQYETPHNNLGRHGQNGILATTNMLLPRTDEFAYLESSVCDLELRTWFSQLDADVRYTGANASKGDTRDVSGIVDRAVLHMLYFTIFSVLHRPHSLYECHRPGKTIYRRLQSKAKVRHAALEITNTLQTLLQQNLVDLIPSCGSTIVLNSAMTHLRSNQSTNHNVRQESIAGMETCLQAMDILREVHSGAEMIAHLLEAAIHHNSAIMSACAQDNSNIQRITTIQDPCRGNGGTQMPGSAPEIEAEEADGLEAMNSHDNFSAALSSMSNSADKLCNIYTTGTESSLA